MGQAKQRGTREQRKAQAIAEGRSKDKPSAPIEQDPEHMDPAFMAVVAHALATQRIARRRKR